MLTIATRGQIFLVAGATDMRKAFNTLAAVVRNDLHRDPLTGDLLVFCNRRKDRVKILVFERGGFWLCAKRLESGFTAGGPASWVAGGPVIPRNTRKQRHELRSVDGRARRGPPSLRSLLEYCGTGRSMGPDSWRPTASQHALTPPVALRTDRRSLIRRVDHRP